MRKPSLIASTVLLCIGSACSNDAPQVEWQQAPKATVDEMSRAVPAKVDTGYPTYPHLQLVITDSSFDELVLRSDQPVMVEFYAEWAGPCRMVGPMLQELAKEYEGKAAVGELNVDNNADISMKYGIRNIPAVLYFRNGEVVDRQIGAVPKRVLASKLEALLGR